MLYKLRYNNRVIHYYYIAQFLTLFDHTIVDFTNPRSNSNGENSNSSSEPKYPDHEEIAENLPDGNFVRVRKIALIKFTLKIFVGYILRFSNPDFCSKSKQRSSAERSNLIKNFRFRV